MRVMTVCAVALSFLTVAPLLRVSAQSTPASPSFDVASIHESAPGRVGGRLGVSNPGRAIVENIPLSNLIEYAFDKTPAEIVGSPEWARTRYDITAPYTLPKATDAQVRMMFQKLFAERFKLVTHVETRTMQRYLMLQARADGKLGNRLVPVEDINCERWLAAGNSSVDAGGPSPVTPNGKRPQCSTIQALTYIVGGTQPMSQLAIAFKGSLRAPVIDRTGLTGTFNFDLEFTAPRQIAAGVDGVSIFTAAQEQLGLKLQAEQGPVEVVVIDSLERPTPN